MISALLAPVVLAGCSTTRHLGQISAADFAARTASAGWSDNDLYLGSRRGMDYFEHVDPTGESYIFDSPEDCTFYRVPSSETGLFVRFPYRSIDQNVPLIRVMVTPGDQSRYAAFAAAVDGGTVGKLLDELFVPYGWCQVIPGRTPATTGIRCLIVEDHYTHETLRLFTGSLLAERSYLGGRGGHLLRLNDDLTVYQPRMEAQGAVPIFGMILDRKDGQHVTRGRQFTPEDFVPPLPSIDYRGLKPSDDPLEPLAASVTAGDATSASKAP